MPPKVPGINVSVYWSRPDTEILKGGMVRVQTQELIPYSKTEGWRCFKPEDYQKVLDLFAPPAPEWP